MNTVCAPEHPGAPRPRRVLLLGPGREAVSGVATHLNALLGEAPPAGCELSQFRVGSEGRRESRPGAVLRLAGSPFALAYRLVRTGARIVHINTSLDPKAYWRDLAYLAVAKLLRRRVIYQVHGGALPGAFFAGHPLRSQLLRRVLGWPEAVVVLTRAELSAYRAFAPAARVLRIANAVAIPPADLSPGRYGAGPLEILYLGRLTEEKGLFEAVQAIALLTGRGLEARLRIAGDGAAAGPLRSAIAAAGLGERVILLGAVRGEAKQRLWRQGQVFVLPTYREGLPYALLEAMAAGAVPVVTPVGGIPDVLTDGVQGLLVPPRDPEALAAALERLHRDREALHRMALAGRQRIAEEFSLARLTADFERLYRGLARE